MIQKWAEILPPDCPEQGARPMLGAYFRLVKTMPPMSADFYSYNKLNPTRNIPGKQCLASGLSLWSEAGQAYRMLQHPRFRGWHVIKLWINNDSGVIKKTMGPGHYTFWAYHDFDPLNAWEPL